MSAEIPALVPAEIRIGDTVTFKRKWNDYTVDDGWQLDFLLVKDDGDQYFQIPRGHSFDLARLVHSIRRRVGPPASAAKRRAQ